MAYVLDIDLDFLDLTRRRLGGLVEQASRMGEVARRSRSDVGTAWTGRAAEAVCAEMHGVDRQSGRFVDTLSRAVTAVDTFESLARDALDEAAVLRRRVADAGDDHGAAVRRAQVRHDTAAAGGDATAGARLVREQEAAHAEHVRFVAMLDQGFADLRERVSAGVRALADALAGAVVAPAAPGAVAALGGGFPSAALSSQMRDTALGALGEDLGLAAARHAQGWDLFDNQDAARFEANRLATSVQASTVEGEAVPAADLELLARYAKNPWFAAALVSRLGVVGVAGLAGQAVLTGRALEADHPAAQERARAYAASRQAVLAGVARALTVASNHPDLLPGDFADGLVREASTVPGAAFGLSTLLHLGGQVGPEFATTLAEGIYAAERSDPRGRGVWRELADPARLRGEGIGEGGYELPGRPGWADPLTGVSVMLSRDPATAQSFLLGPDTEHPDQNRLHHFTTVRDWTASDHGAGYGSMIEAATTRLRDHDGEGSPGYRSAQVASQYLHEVNTEDLPSPLKRATGHVLAAYIIDVQRSQTGEPEPVGVHEGPDPHLPAGSQSYGARLTWEDSRQLLRAVMGDDEAFRSVMAAQQSLAQQQLDHTGGVLQRAAAGSDRAAAATAWNAATRNAALLWGASIDAANVAHIEDAKDVDARSTALRQLASAATNTVPVPGGKAVEFLFSQARQHVVSQPPTQHETDARHEAYANLHLAEHTLRGLVLTAAAAHNLFDDGAALYAERPPPPYDSAHDFIRPDGTITPWDQMTPEQQEGYDTWMISNLADLQERISGGVNSGIEKYR
jgi:hypothetical protein